MQRKFGALVILLLTFAIGQCPTAAAAADIAAVPTVGQALRLPQPTSENLYLRTWLQDQAKFGEACLLRPQSRITVVAYLPQLDVIIVGYDTDTGSPKHLARYCLPGDLLKMNRWQYDRLRQRIVELERPQRESEAIRQAVQSGLEQIKK